MSVSGVRKRLRRLQEALAELKARESSSDGAHSREGA